MEDDNVQLRALVAQALNGDDCYYLKRTLPDGRTIGVHIQLYNVALHIYPPGPLLWWSEQY